MFTVYLLRNLHIINYLHRAGMQTFFFSKHLYTCSQIFNIKAVIPVCSRQYTCTISLLFNTGMGGGGGGVGLGGYGQVPLSWLLLLMIVEPCLAYLSQALHNMCSPAFFQISILVTFHLAVAQIFAHCPGVP